MDLPIGVDSNGQWIEMNALKCAFCGSDKLDVGRWWTSDEHKLFYVYCCKCKARGPIMNDSVKEAVHSWNARETT